MSVNNWQKEGNHSEDTPRDAFIRSFAEDDAFADGDDGTDFKFSTEAVRAEFAHTLSSPSEEGAKENRGPPLQISSPPPSIASLDVTRNNSGHSSLGSPLHPSASTESSTNFEQISLDGYDSGCDAPSEKLVSDDGLDPSPTGPQTPQDNFTDEVSRIESPRQVPAASPVLRAVVIDASQLHPTPIEIHPIAEGEPGPSLSDRPRLSLHSETTTSPSASIPPIEHAKSTSDLRLSSLNPPVPGWPSSSHRKSSSSQGPSIFEQVVSKTRPSFLPPKKKEEDIKHMHDWEQMMKRSRAAEEKRRKALQVRRLAREAEIEESLHTWEKDVVPNWKAVREVPRLRNLWWAGIPTKLRAFMWERAVGNALALSKDSYRTCLSRAKRALTAGTFPTTTLGLIEEDVSTTLPGLHIFNAKTGPMYEDLRDMLYAWAVSRSDEGLGYVRGIAKLAAMIILNMPAPQGFIVLRNLLERHCMRSFYGGLSTKDDVEAYYRIFDTLLADGMPKIYFNFKQHQISPAAYLPDWILPLFLDHLPFEACARLWDVILLEGDAFLYRASLAILAVLEPRLFFPDRRELLELLRGESSAAVAVARRDGRPLDGGKYEIYGVDEETVWERISGMEEWWKESTWQRLLQRELPDL